PSRSARLMFASVPQSQSPRNSRGFVEIEIPLTVAASLQQGVHSSVITVGFQMCDGQMCLAPEYVDLPIEIVINNVRR
ncbi:MAG TPA: hypothetical protein VK147_12845, partial [Candidatus Didemnitutus sp.]|nr:hypothetical protein [Candidatus Didemnitutus sp.]